MLLNVLLLHSFQLKKLFNVRHTFARKQSSVLVRISIFKAEDTELTDCHSEVRFFLRYNNSTYADVTV